MTIKKGKSIGYLFLGLSLISAILAASLFFYKSDNTIYNLSLSAPNSLPKDYISFLKNNEKWKAVINFAELYKNKVESNSEVVCTEIKNALGDITDNEAEAREKRKTFSYWKKETLNAISLKQGDDAPQESVSKALSFGVDFLWGDYFVLYDSAKKYIKNEDIDEFNTALSALNVSLGITDLASGGTTAAVNKPTQYLLYVFRKGAGKMSQKLRSELILQLKIIAKNPSKISRFKSLTNIAIKSPQMAIWLVGIPNTLEQGERLWALLSNSLEKNDMQNVINQGTMMLTFSNNPEMLNNLNNKENDVQKVSDSSSIENSLNLHETNSIPEKKEPDEINSTKGVFDKTMDYLGKKKDEILNKDSGVSGIEEKENKILFAEESMINSLEEIITVLEIMDKQKRLSSQDLFFALCYGQQGINALKENKLQDFMSYRDSITNNLLESKAKSLITQNKKIFLIALTIISLISFVTFISIIIRKSKSTNSKIE